VVRLRMFLSIIVITFTLGLLDNVIMFNRNFFRGKVSNFQLVGFFPFEHAFLIVFKMADELILIFIFTLLLASINDVRVRLKGIEVEFVAKSTICVRNRISTILSSVVYYYFFKFLVFFSAVFLGLVFYNFNA